MRVRARSEQHQEEEEGCCARDQDGEADAVGGGGAEQLRCPVAKARKCVRKRKWLVGSGPVHRPCGMWR